MISFLQQSFFILYGTSKSASFIAEELTFQQFPTECRTVECEEGTFTAITFIVNSLCKHLLTRTRFTIY